MGRQVCAHRRERLEELREDARPGIDDGVLGIGDVEPYRSVVGVDHDLDAVAHVVHAGEQVARQRLRVRVAVGGRVGVPDPQQPPLGADQVRVAVIGEERRDRLHALLQGAAEEDLRGIGQLVADQQVQVAESQGEEQAVEEATDADGGRSLPAGGGGRVAADGVVELAGLGADDDVGARALVEVDPRLAHR